MTRSEITNQLTRIMNDMAAISFLASDSELGMAEWARLCATLEQAHDMLEERRDAMRPPREVDTQAITGIWL